MLEEGIAEGGNLVEVNVGLATGEAEGGGGGDEVDLVTAGCELDAKLSGDHAGAAIGGIAGDADATGLDGRFEGHGFARKEVRSP